MGKVTQDDLVNVDDLIQQSKDSGNYVDVNSLIADGTIQKKNPSGNGLNQPSPSQSQSPLQSGSVKTFDDPALKLSDGGVPVENTQNAPSRSQFLNQQAGQAVTNTAPSKEQLLSKKETGQQALQHLGSNQQPDVSESTKAIQPEQSLQDEQAKENSKQREATVKKELPVAYKNTAKQYFESQKITPTSAQLQQKVDELKQSKDDGNLVLGHDSQGNPRMERNVGGFAGLWLGVKQGFKAEGEARKFQDMSEEDRIKFMNDKLNNDKEYLPANTQFSALGSLGQSLGSGAPLLAETAAGATIGGLLTAAAPETGGLSLEGLAPTLAFIFSAQGAAHVGYMDEYIKRFKEAKDEGLSDDEAYKKVGNLPLLGEATSLATNAFLSRIPISKATGEGFTSAIDQYLKSGIKSSGEFAGASAVGNTASELTAKASGFNKNKSIGDIALESGQQAVEAGLTGLALHAITHPETYTALPKYVRAQLKGYLSKANPIEVAEAMDEMAQKGFANQDDADKAKGKLKSYIDANKSVPPNLDETKSAVITGLIEKKKSLEAEKQKLDPAFHGDLDKQIADIDGKINLAKNSDNPLQFESDDLTGEHNLNPKSHDELTAKEKEGIVVPKEYGGTEVEEVGGKGEDAETKYKPTAYVTESKGSLELKQPIEVGDKTYSDKQKAQEAADKALKQHYYENGLHESGKPQKKQQDNGLQLQKEEETSKVTEPATAGAGGETAPAETEAAVDEKPLSRDEVKSLHDNLTPEQKQEYLDQELEGKGDEYLKSLNNGKTLPNAAAEEKPKEEPQAEVIQPKGVEGDKSGNEKATEGQITKENTKVGDIVYFNGKPHKVVGFKTLREGAPEVVELEQPKRTDQELQDIAWERVHARNKGTGLSEDEFRKLHRAEFLLEYFNHKETNEKYTGNVTANFGELTKEPKGVEGNQPSNEPQPSEESGVAETKPIEPTQEDIIAKYRKKYPAFFKDINTENGVHNVLSHIYAKAKHGSEERIELGKYLYPTENKPTETKPIEAPTEQNTKLKEIEDKYTSDIHEANKADLKLDLVADEDLSKHEDARKLRKKQQDIVKRLSKLQELVKCK
jgi:hypothetical protein